MSPFDLAPIGFLIGEPTRAAILADLMDGRALTAGELAARARVTAPTASSRLSRLVQGGLLVVVRQGRHRHYRLAGALLLTPGPVVLRLAGGVRGVRRRCVRLGRWVLRAARDLCAVHVFRRSGATHMRRRG